MGNSPISPDPISRPGATASTRLIRNTQAPLPFTELAEASPSKNTKALSSTQKLEEAHKNLEATIKKLPPKHREKLGEIYQAIEIWAKDQEKQGKKPVRLAQFLYRSMEYSDEQLQAIESQFKNPEDYPPEYYQLDALFQDSSDTLDAFGDFVKDPKTR